MILIKTSQVNLSFDVHKYRKWSFHAKENNMSIGACINYYHGVEQKAESERYRFDENNTAFLLSK